MKKGLILLSGGLDSSTVAADAIAKGYALHAITFNYGQKHKAELVAVENITKFFKIKNHQTINIDTGIFQNSALTNDIDIPKGRDLELDEIPNTYVPARNILFLSYALAIAEGNDIHDIFIGANAVDYSGYPDCRPEFINSFEQMANLGTKLGQSQKITIHAPLIHLTKAEIIKKGLELNLDYSITHSCYDPNPKGESCGKCDSCRLRLKGFAENNINDPIKYAA